MIKNINDFFELKKDWDRLYNPVDDTPFQSFSYNLISWENCNLKGKLFILVYNDSNNIIQAILPLYITNKKELRFINDKDTDFCDLIYNRDIHLIDVIEEFILFIDQQKRIKRVILENIRTNSPLLPYFKIFKRNSLTYSSNEYSYIECNKNSEPITTLKNLSGGKKKKLKKIINQCKNFTFEIYNYKTQPEFPVEPLICLANVMVKQKKRAASNYNEHFWNYLKSAYKNEILEVAILTDEENKPLSAGFVFINQSIAVRWVILYVEPKYNLWNNINYIHYKGQEQNIIINFGRGGYDYKINNFRPYIDNLYKVEYNISTFGWLKIWRDFNSYYLKKILKSTYFYKFLFNNLKRILN